MNRAANQTLLDANSQTTLSFLASAVVNTTNSTTTIVGAGPGVFHGFIVNATGAGALSVTIYDASTTAASGLTSATAIGALASTTLAGAVPFQWGGDVIYNNGLVVVAAGGTIAPFKVLYL